MRGDADKPLSTEQEKKAASYGEYFPKLSIGDIAKYINTRNLKAVDRIVRNARRGMAA